MTTKPKTGEGPKRIASGTLRRPPSVLFVDDMVDSREVYGEILRFAGYRVVEATDGEAALQSAFARCPDIVIMDLCLPRLDGWEAIRLLKADPRTSGVPIIVLSALTPHSAKLEVDCDAYLVKPCLPLDLLGVVESLVAAPAPSRLSR
jgi:CheY-like chemotaxis protein